MDTLSALGKRIQKLRQKVGVTQEQLAERAGISPKNLSEIENGRGNPTLTSLEGLAAALGIALTELFDFEHESLSPEEIREELHSSINNATDQDCRIFYRLLKVLTK
jgi:transcriptional regulator with XRE-family HTH domain